MAKFLATDIIAVLIFAILARIAHGGLEITTILNTFWPFAIGVLIAWIFVRHRVPAALGSGVIVWITTAVCGLAIWGIRHSQVPHWSFIIVACVMSALLLLGWRAVLALFTQRQA